MNHIKLFCISLFGFCMALPLWAQNQTYYGISVNHSERGSVIADADTAISGQTVCLTASASADYSQALPYVTNSSSGRVNATEGLPLLSNGKGNSLAGWTDHTSSPYGECKWTIIDDAFATSYNSGALTQTIDLLEKGYTAKELDRGTVAVTFALQVWAQYGSTDARATVQLLDASYNVLETITVFDDTSAHGDWYNYSKSFTIPSGTRKVLVSLEGTDALYWSGYYGPRFRNLQFYATTIPLAATPSNLAYYFTMPASGVTITPFSIHKQQWMAYRKPFEGSGTADDPYLIATPENLAQLAYNVNILQNIYEDKIFVQTADIDLYRTFNDKRVGWRAIGQTSLVSFYGHFFGQMLWGDNPDATPHTIRNLYTYHTTADDGTDGYDYETYYGVFGTCYGTLRDINVADADLQITTAQFAYVGLICGEQRNLSNASLPRNSVPSLFNCSAKGKIAVHSSEIAYVGGCCGHTYSAFTGIQRCSSDVEITMQGMAYGVGGIVGFGYGANIIDCSAQVNISASVNNGEAKIGGVVGHLSRDANSSSLLRASTASGNIAVAVADGVSEKCYVGGVAGYVTGFKAANDVVRSCVSTVDLSGNATLGGIVAYLYNASVSHCQYAGHIDASRATLACGLVANARSIDSEVLSNSLMTGTIFTGADTSKVYLLSDAQGDPLVMVNACFYDKWLADHLKPIPATKATHPSVIGLTTEELTSGSSAQMRNYSDGSNFGFTFTKGYYPTVFNLEDCCSRYASADPTARAAKIAEAYGSTKLQPLWFDNLDSETLLRPQKYKALAWLASIPVALVYGDFAYDLVSGVEAKLASGIYTTHEFNAQTQTWEEQLTRVNNLIEMPANTPCVAIEGYSATAVANGTFKIKLSALGNIRPFGFNICTLNSIWDGSVATGFLTGEGSKTKPFIIRSAPELAYAVQNNAKNFYYRQITNLHLNKRLIDFNLVPGFLTNISPRTGYHEWFGNTSWKGFYDGTGHYVYGLYFFLKQDIKDEAYGLFSNIESGASVERVGVVDSYIDSEYYKNGTIEGYAFCRNAIGMLAGLCEGTLSQCLAQGVINNYRRVYSTVGKFHYEEYIKYDYIGSLVGRVGQHNASALVQDCVSAVSYDGLGSIAGAFTTRLPNVSKGRVERSLALSPIIYYGNWVDADGTTHPQETESLDDSPCLTDCHYPYGYRYSSPEGTVYSDETLAQLSTAFASAKAWTVEANYFPMLTCFAKTYGKYLTLPFLPETDDYLLNIGKQVTFNPGNFSWNIPLVSKREYFEIDGDMGVVVPLKDSKIGPEWQASPTYLRGTSSADGEQVILQINTRFKGVQPGITFVDENARKLCVDYFDTNADGILTLGELSNTTTERTLEAFSNTAASRIRQFPEFRYFKAVDNLTTQLAQMSSLEEIQLPYALTHISSDAFSGCTSLREVSLPANVAKVEPHAFYQSAVESIRVDKFNTTFTSRDGLLFNTDSCLVAYPNGRRGPVTISGLTTEILEGAIYKIADADSIFLDGPDYTTVTYLNPDGIVSASADLPDIFVKDATYDATLLTGYEADDSWYDFYDDHRLHRYYPLRVSSAKAATSKTAATDAKAHEAGPADTRRTLEDTSATDYTNASTLYIGFDTNLPESLRPFTVHNVDETGGVAYLEHLLDLDGKATNALPSLTPVIVFASEPGLYKLFPIDGPELYPFPMYRNRLNGSDRDGTLVYQEDAIRGTMLTLSADADGQPTFSFYKGRIIAPYTAYLPLSDIAGAQSISLVIDEITAADAPVADTERRARFAIYDLTGRQQRHLLPGINIVGGKKVLVAQ